MSSTDRQLLFGVLALQLELITVDQFVEACTIWASKKDRPLPDLLFDRGWLQAQDKSDIDRLLARKLEKHGGDAAASLQEAAKDTRVRQSLLSIGDDDINRTLDPTPPPHGVAVVATRAFEPKGHDRYTLSRLHAQGGIGRVWLAHDVTLRREVALKELRPEKTTNDALLGRFLREARVTGQLEHPGIVPIYEVGQRPDDQAPYYTMRFIRGQTLAEAADDYHKRRRTGEAGPLELRKLLSAFVGVCNAIGYAHSRGVLHRDLKPQNIVLGGFGEVIVLDWGLARLIDENEKDAAGIDLGTTLDLEKTQDGQRLGTPPYMAPEQAMGRSDLLSPATDVYGLGAVLYHLLTNGPPFAGSNQEETMRQVIADPPKPPRELVQDVHPALESVCLKALSKKGGDRYESATALADEVQHWLADEPVKAYPEPLFVKTARWMRRRKAFVAAASVFLVCATLALTGITVVVWRERTETDRHLARTVDFVGQVIAGVDSANVDAMSIRGMMVEAGVGTLREIRRERPTDDRLVVPLARLLTYDATAKRLARRPNDAEAALKEAIDLLEPLLERVPSNQTCRSVLARTYYTLGATVKEAGRRRDAAASHERAIKLYEDSALTEYRERFHYAVAANELSIVYFGWKPMPEAEEAARRAAELLRGVPPAKTVKETAFAKRFLSGALNRVAQCQRETGRAAESLSLLDETASIMEALLKDEPHDQNNVHFRAFCWLHRARSLAAIRGSESDALPAFGKAIEIWLPLAKSNLDVFSLPLAQAYAHRADLHRRGGRLKEAEDDLEAARKTLDALPASSHVNTDYLTSRSLVDAARTRLALARKDAGAVARCLSNARAAYKDLLVRDPDNELERRALENLEKDVAKG